MAYAWAHASIWLRIAARSIQLSKSIRSSNISNLFGLVFLVAALQLRVRACLHLPERCELPLQREDNCRGTNGLSQQTLLLSVQALCFGYITSHVWADGRKTRGRKRVTHWQISPDDPPTIRLYFVHLKFKFKEWQQVMLTVERLSFHCQPTMQI